jgi:hypothetical protein
MLECFLDDSGTHDGSRVLGWGAMSGDKLRLDELDLKWKARLADPCDGRKPPIKKFHSWDLYHGRGEFSGYNEAEKDRTRYNFRTIATDLKLTWFFYGISMDAWKKVAADHKVLGQVFTAESFILAGLFKKICEEAHKYGEPIAFFINQERFTPELVTNIKVAIEKAKVPDQFVSYTGAPVKGVTGLQAADLVAHEVFRFYVERLDNPKAQPNAHLKSLAENVHSFQDGWFGEEDLRKMIEKIEGTLNWEEAFSEKA